MKIDLSKISENPIGAILGGIMGYAGIFLVYLILGSGIMSILNMAIYGATSPSPLFLSDLILWIGALIGAYIGAENIKL